MIKLAAARRPGRTPPRLFARDGAAADLRGDLPAVKLGSGPKAPVRVAADELEDWLESRHVERIHSVNQPYTLPPDVQTPGQRALCASRPRAPARSGSRWTKRWGGSTT